MVNPSGRNGRDNGQSKSKSPPPQLGLIHDFRYSEPADDILKASLMQYARECLTLDRRIERLAEEHGYFIR